MQIFVNTSSNKPIALKVKATDIIENVKTKVCEILKIPPDQQRLHFDGMPLEDCLALKDYNIEDGTNLDIVASCDRDGMQIFITTTMTFKFQRSDTIKDLKEKILKEARKIHPDHYKMIFSDKHLESGRTFISYYDSIQENSTLYLCNINFRIFVEFWPGKIITLDVTASDTIDTIEEKIQELEGTPLSQQRLIFEGRRLMGGRFLSDYDIQNETTLYMIPSLSVDLKYLIQRETGIPADEQRLIIRGKELMDHRIINCHDIPPNSTLNLERRPPTEIKIFVTTTVAIQVQPLDTIGNAKAKFLDEVRSQHLDLQRLYHNNEQLADDCTLSNLNIQKESTLILRGCMLIYVKTWIGKIITLEVEVSDTVQSVKDEIQRKEGISSAHHCLIFAGKWLEDNHTLLSYNVKKYSTFYLMHCSNCPNRVYDC